MAFQQESELLECFNHHFIKMIQSGVMGQINLRAETINEKFNSIDDAVTLSYMNVAFPSLILLGGVLISVFQLLIEQDWASIIRFSGGVGGMAKRVPSLGSLSAGSAGSGASGAWVWVPKSHKSPSASAASAASGAWVGQSAQNHNFVGDNSM